MTPNFALQPEPTVFVNINTKQSECPRDLVTFKTVSASQLRT